MNRGRLLLDDGATVEMRGLRNHDGGAGRIYPVDPAAVARLKRILAEQPTRRRRPAARGRTAAAQMAAQMLARKQAREESEMARGTTIMNDELARELHARAVAGESAAALADEVGYAHQASLNSYWRRLGLPSVREARKAAAAAEAGTETAVSEAAELPAAHQVDEDETAALDGQDQAEVVGTVIEQQAPTFEEAIEQMGEIWPEYRQTIEAAADEAGQGQEHTYPELPAAATSNQAVLDAFDRRLARLRSLADELSEKGVQVRVSGRIVLELEL